MKDKIRYVSAIGVILRIGDQRESVSTSHRFERARRDPDAVEILENYAARLRQAGSCDFSSARAGALISVHGDVSRVDISSIFTGRVLYLVCIRARDGKPRTRTRWVCPGNSHAARARRSIILKASALVKIVADSFLLSRVCRASNELH